MFVLKNNIKVMKGDNILLKFLEIKLLPITAKCRY